jgi:hypothetical protein
MSEPRQLQEIVVRPAGGRSLIEGEDLSSINHVLVRIQQTAKTPAANTLPQPKPPERK